MVKLKMRGKHLLAGWLLILLLMQTAVPIAAANTTTISTGNYTISSNGLFQLPDTYSGTISIADSVYEATVIGSVYSPNDIITMIDIGSSRTTALTLTLQDIEINNASGHGIDLGSTTADVTLNIGGDCTIQASRAGIHAPGGNSLFIDSLSGNDDEDTLTVSSGTHCAGIGGYLGEDGGNITISGGTVNASGGSNGAGIGGGNGTPPEVGGGGGTITINGGVVNAQGGSGGAGIGGGNGGDDNADGGHIYLNGGIITATGGDCGAGIGGGYNGKGAAVQVQGNPTIIATGSTSDNAQHIGHGYNTSDSGSLIDGHHYLSYLRFHVVDVGNNDISGATVSVDDHNYTTNGSGLTGCTVEFYSTPSYTVSKTDYAAVYDNILADSMNLEKSVTLEESAQVDLAIDVTYDGGNTQGETGTFSITVTNNGPEASNSIFTAIYTWSGLEMRMTSIESGVTVYQETDQITAIYRNSLAAGASALLTEQGVEITGSPGSTLNFTATVSTHDHDSNAANNSDSVSFIIQAVDSSITPTTSSFDKYSGSADYQDITVSMTLNGNTLNGIKNGDTALTAGADYTVSGSTATINKSYLEQQSAGTTTLTFDFSAGADQSLDITISDSTPAINNSSISPTTTSFDKYSGSTNYQDIAVSMTLNGNTLSSIKNGGTALTAGTDYTVSGNTATINKSYLEQQTAGTTTLTFDFSAGADQTLVITISDSTPAFNDSSISPTTVSFDKYSGSANYQDIAISMTLNGNTLSSIKNGVTDLTEGTDYTVSGNTATINKSYLAQQATGTTTLTFDFSAGADQTLVITISDSTPAFNDSSISPTTVSFDKYSGSANYQDIAISMTLNGNTLSSIKNGGTDLTAGADYTVSGNTATINKSYLAQQATGTTTLTFDFSAGADQILTITVSDSTPSSSGGGGGSSSRTVHSSTGSAQVYPSKGGKISLGDEVTLDIPKGALQGNARVPVTIKKTDISQALPSSFMLLGQAYEFQVGGESSYNFDEPVTLTFTFDPDKVPPGEIPAIYYYDPVTLQWVKLGGTISGNTITIEIDHFTTFAVLVEQSGAGNGTEEISFSDIDGHWAETAIEELTAQGSIGGYPDETFRPDRPITRAEFVSVLVKALDLPSTDSSTAFSDIENHWARDDINIAVANGFINGYNDNTFKPDDPITREQMAAIIVKAAKLEISSEATSFVDNDKISPWARGSVTAAVNNGLMGGYPNNSFNPRGQATRAEAVTVILNV